MSVKMEVSLAWWFNWAYLYPLLLFCFIFDKDLNGDRVQYWMRKAIKTREVNP